MGQRPEARPENALVKGMFTWFPKMQLEDRYSDPVSHSKHLTRAEAVRITAQPSHTALKKDVTNRL